MDNYASMNIDSEITLEETLPLRTSYVGPLQFKFKLGANFPGPNSGKCRVRLPKRSVYGEAGGFSYDSNKKIVCQLKDILTHEEYGCIVTDVTDDNTASNENDLLTLNASHKKENHLTVSGYIRIVTKDMNLFINIQCINRSMP